MSFEVKMISKNEFKLGRRHKQISFGVMAVGIVAVVIGFVMDPTRTWVNLMVDGYYFLSLALAGLIFIAILYLTSAAWSAGIRRIPEAMMGFLPVASLLMLILYFGRESLYPWTDHEFMHHHPALSGKAFWLSAPFFFFRMFLILGLWSIFAWLIRRASVAQDRGQGSQSSESLLQHQRIFRFSAIFVPLFAITFCLASFDWLMSIEPHWYSTIYAILNFSSLFLHGVAFVTLVVILLQERGYLVGIVNENHLHDLGKIILAFSIFWVSMWVNQYMLIWYGNISEEVVYYAVRTDRDWWWLFILNVVLNWVVPFLILLPRASKRSPAVLKRVCMTLLVGYWLDIYLMVAPGTVKTRSIGPLEILMALGYGALFFYIVSSALSRAPLVACNDPYLEESLHHHQ